MKLPHRNSGYLFTALIALVFTIPVFMLFPSRINKKFFAITEEYQLRSDGSVQQYADLNHDGWSERLISGSNNPQSVFITISVRDGIIGQWNFPGFFPKGNTRFITGDYDNNGFDELYVFVIQQDSLWLYAFEPLNDDNKETLKVLIDIIKPRDGIIEAHIREGGISDMNGDSYSDLVFGVEASFSAYPRKVMIYDIHNGVLNQSAAIGSGIHKLVLHDLDGDGINSIILHTVSHCNTTPNSVPYDDHSSWLMVMDNELRFRFEPIKLEGEFSMLSVYPLGVAGQNYLVGLHNIYGGLNQNSALYIFDLEGNVLSREDLIQFDSQRIATLFPFRYKSKDELFVSSSTDGRIHKINLKLEVEKAVAYWEARVPPTIADINNDGNDEIILLNAPGSKLRIFQANFTHPVDVDLYEPSPFDPIASIIKKGNGPAQLAIQVGRSFLRLSFRQNNYYAFRYFLYGFAYLATIALVFLIQHLAKRRLKQRVEIERQLSALQLNNISNQLDPHFTFNILHSIGASILTHDKEDAYDYLIRFSKLIRSGLADSNVICRSIAKEIEAINAYLDLMQRAYRNKFDYAIHIGEQVNVEWMLPKMILQIHIENAINHGILPGNKKGLLQITFDSDSKFINLTIEDNGIGRKEALKKNSHSSRKGLILLNQFIEFFNSFNAEKFQHEFIDLHSTDGQPAGTLVKIKIPVDYDFAVYER